MLWEFVEISDYTKIKFCKTYKKKKLQLSNKIILYSEW
jgi:hypothetical protein